jgi:hypothetical protein
MAKMIRVTAFLLGMAIASPAFAADHGITGGANITVDTHGITVAPSGDIATTRDPSRCVIEVDGSGTITGVHPVPCHIDLPSAGGVYDTVIEAHRP